MTDYIYDEETFPNCFTIAFKNTETKQIWQFEISDRMNQGVLIVAFCNSLKDKHRMVGFNNLNFDYPILHELLLLEGAVDSYYLYSKAMAIINSDGGFGHMVWESQHYVPQIDLFKIHHFDNQAKRTSLKMLEFNLRSYVIQDLPFEPGTMLTHAQMDELRVYNVHDVNETEKLYEYTLPAIRFREQLTVKYGRNFLNHNDTKIGKDYVIMQLEVAGVHCYNQDRSPIQTRRKSINLNDAVFPWIQFMSPELTRIKQWFQEQVITDTNGTFKDISCTVKGFQFDFGLGGIHGSINNSVVRSDSEYLLMDLDVTSYYSNIAIINRIYPEHLTELFCDIYTGVMQQRKQYAKGTIEYAMLKLALNGVFGDSNNIYSVFYDPLFTMKITINGQLLLCMLAEHLLNIPDLTLVQANTDGLTIRVHRDQVASVEFIKKWWMGLTKMNLEVVHYKSMFIRDVNNYLAVSEDGKYKYKGAYRHKFDPTNINIGIGDLDWHQDHSALIIPKTADAILNGSMMTVQELITTHSDIYDFCLRTKVPRGSRLVLHDSLYGDWPLQNICRYYISQRGMMNTSGTLVKIMPPLKGKTDPRRIGIDVGWYVTPCNNMAQAINPIDYNYYISETRKLIEPLKELV